MAVNGDRPKDITQFVHQLKECAFLYVGHGVAGLAVLHAAHVHDANGAVVALCMRPIFPNGPSTFDGSFAVVEDDEMVTDVRPIARR